MNSAELLIQLPLIFISSCNFFNE